MNLQWKSDGTSAELISIENFSFQMFYIQIYGQFKFPYFKIFELHFFFRETKKLTPVRPELSTSRSVVRYFIHSATELIDVTCK